MITIIFTLFWLAGWIYSLWLVERVDCILKWWGGPALFLIWPIFLLAVLVGMSMK
jgi:hypothetical protein